MVESYFFPPLEASQRSIFVASSPPISLNPKPSPRATSTQHIIRSSLWASDVEKGDSNFRVSKSNSVAAAASRDGSLLEGSGFESPNLSVLEVEKTQDASSLPRRYAQSIALRSPNTRAHQKTINQRRAARKRVKVTKESKKLCFLAKFRAFRAFPILSARCHALSRRLRCP